MVWRIQGRTMSKSTSSAFRICVTHRGLDDLSHCYELSKSSEISKKNGRATRRYEKKIRPQYWVLGSDTESAWDQHGWFHADSMAALKTHYCGRIFFSQRLLFLVTDSKFHSLPTLSSNNSCSKPVNHLILYIFGILRTSAFTWSYPGYVFQYQNLK